MKDKPTYEELWDLLNRLYIARNISLGHNAVLDCLQQIDKWMYKAGRDENSGN